MKRIKSAIKNFLLNLKVIIKVQKRALVSVLGTFGISALSLVAITYAGWVVTAGLVLVLTIPLLLAALVTLRHQYVVLVKDAAKVEVKISNKKAYKKRKAADKASRKAQDHNAEASRIENTYENR